MPRPSYRVRTFRIPVSKFRLYSSIPAAAFFSILLYLASVTLGWFTTTAGFFLLLGVIEGSLVGLYEASVVTGELAKKTETTAWRALLIFLLSFLPLLLMIIRYGIYVSVPYIAYFGLPFIPAYEAMSGWRYNKFEKYRKVQIFTLYYIGIRFWTEPPIVSKRVPTETDVSKPMPMEGVEDLSPGFSEFITSVVSKDFSGIFYGANYSERLIADLKKRPEVDRSTRDFLSKILEMMKTYQQRLRAVVWAFTILSLVILTNFFVLALTNGFGSVRIVDERGVIDNQAMLVIFVIPCVLLFGGVATARLLLKRRYKERLSTLLESMKPDMSSNLKSLVET